MTVESRTGQVRLAFSPDASLLRVVRGAVYFVAQQSHFAEAEALNLTHAVEQACRITITEQARERLEETLRLRLDIFPDRLEVTVEEGNLAELAETSPDAFLIARGVDRVVQETEEGVSRVTLVKYRRRSAPPGAG